MGEKIPARKRNEFTLQSNRRRISPQQKNLFLRNLKPQFYETTANPNTTTIEINYFVSRHKVSQNEKD